MKKLRWLTVGVVLLAGTSVARAEVLIINGSIGTTEPATTAQATANLSALLAGAGFSPTVVSDVPASFAGFSQLYDIRFSNNQPITGAQQAQYLSFLQGGGGLFVVGEHQSFPARNASVLGLISLAGGGTLTFELPSAVSPHTVLPPFTGPNLVNTISYASPGGVGAVAGAGTGQFVSMDALGRGSGVAFSPGDLASAPAGQLVAMFDVNFLQPLVDPVNSNNLTRNIIEFQSSVQAIAEPGSLTVFGVGVFALAGYRWSRVKKKVA